MSVQIVIKPGGVFENPGATQSDLLFWYNTDSESHYPVPGCTGLKVEPGKNTSASPYLASPNYASAPPATPPAVPYLPHTFDYICALHGETGQITIDADSGQVVTLNAPAAGAVAKEIAIGSGGTFATVDITQSQTVFWTNNDNVAHFPVPNCTGLLAKPDAVTNDTQIVPIPALPMAIAYGCAIAGHENESGTINVYGDLAVASPPPALSSATPYVAVAAATGGKSPYAIVQDSAVPYITAVDTVPAGSSAGVSLVLNAAPPAGTKAVSVQVNVTDALKNNITTTIQVTLT
ncbi:MAG: hypothetical protein QOK37_2586 [Thermoanaerobaculia bacterium]|jgi:hypothetical protein|nr:hypothetical protein [Thermoanaerobaculia bacterium]